jgi:2-isopropylmalate synthase
MGKLSGRKALQNRLEQLGFELNPQELNDVFRRFKVGNAWRIHARKKV